MLDRSAVKAGDWVRYLGCSFSCGVFVEQGNPQISCGDVVQYVGQKMREVFHPLPGCRAQFTFNEPDPDWSIVHVPGISSRAVFIIFKREDLEFVEPGPPLPNDAGYYAEYFEYNS